MSVARRSRPGDPSACDVFLADSLGEMDMWYARAGRVFVAGSLVDKGGHTPYEPATHGCALLHGPHVGNFANAYRRLAQAGAARNVSSPQEIAKALTSLSTKQDQVSAGRAAQEVLRPETNADWLVAALLEHLEKRQ